MKIPGDPYGFPPISQGFWRLAFALSELQTAVEHASNACIYHKYPISHGGKTWQNTIYFGPGTSPIEWLPTLWGQHVWELVGSWRRSCQLRENEGGEERQKKGRPQIGLKIVHFNAFCVGNRQVHFTSHNLQITLIWNMEFPLFGQRPPYHCHWQFDEVLNQFEWNWTRCNGKTLGLRGWERWYDLGTPPSQ